ncbi:MAG: SAM-dependent methyltransferase [Deltaproteobacteria bacterium]|jgi:precorrin-4/cobalt-precorrin-4 C11-methyltransferase|nr:SAM-dependent methyltransferase [Deltaproteobacteria bacterium]MCL5880375.1 SAM-dependent methyltransferase [Deltaproteobacteria bacterium]MDA8303803.1 SAM-dependent methyltransferase [Deltaproteobacteria bacterium]
MRNEAGIISPEIYFVGAGPGDPELLTVKAYNILKKSDVVFYAGSLINPKVLEIFKNEVLLIDMKSLNFDEIKERLVNLLKLNSDKDEARIISILHAGDSSIYSSINEQMTYLEEMGIDYEIIPGVTAAFAASAANRSTLTLPDVSQTVIFCRGEGRTGKMPKGQDIKSLAKHNATMAIYLSFGIIESVVRDLLEHYPLDTPCLIARDVSLESELLIGCLLKDVVKTAEEYSVKNMAVLIVGDALKGKYYEKNRSKLYDKSFSHSFRLKEGG